MLVDIRAMIVCACRDCLGNKEIPAVLRAEGIPVYASIDMLAIIVYKLYIYIQIMYLHPYLYMCINTYV